MQIAIDEPGFFCIYRVHSNWDEFRAMDRIYQIHNLPVNSKTIQRIEDLTEVKSMLEANTKNWEKAVLEKGIGIGVKKGHWY